MHSTEGMGPLQDTWDPGCELENGQQGHSSACLEFGFCSPVGLQAVRWDPENATSPQLIPPVSTDSKMKMEKGSSVRSESHDHQDALRSR